MIPLVHCKAGVAGEAGDRALGIFLKYGKILAVHCCCKNTCRGCFPAATLTSKKIDRKKFIKVEAVFEHAHWNVLAQNGIKCLRAPFACKIQMCLFSYCHKCLPKVKKLPLYFNMLAGNCHVKIE
jgi:hypothetical protein